MLLDCIERNPPLLGVVRSIDLTRLYSSSPVSCSSSMILLEDVLAKESIHKLGGAVLVHTCPP
jgi:hypothetical protein